MKSNQEKQEKKAKITHQLVDYSNGDPVIIDEVTTKEETKVEVRDNNRIVIRVGKPS